MIGLIIFIFVSLFYCSYVDLEGEREGMYYYFRTKVEDANLKEHTLFTWQRAFVLTILAVLLYFLLDSILFSSIGMASYLLIFPFIHDNRYYITRDELDPTVYSKSLNNQSTTSTAYSDKKELFTPRNRNILFALGIAGILTIIILTLIK